MDNEIIKIQNEIQLYLQNISAKTYEEIWNKKEEIMKIPSPELSEYISKLIAIMDAREQVEKNEFIQRVKKAELDELDGIVGEADAHHYSNQGKNDIRNAACERRLLRQREILEEMIANLLSLDRKGLKKLEEDIKAKTYENSLTTEYVNKVNAQFDALEEKELNYLCVDLEKKNIDELDRIRTVIKEMNYQDRFANKYLDMIANRIEYLHIQNMEQTVLNVAEADKDELAKIKEAIDNEDCRNEVKERFYKQITEREEKIEYDYLCSLTEGIENRNLTELNELYNKLKTGDYNEKFIKSFLQKVRIEIELTQVAFCEEQASKLKDMDKAAVLELKENIESCGFEPRVDEIIKQKIGNRLYELESEAIIAELSGVSSMSLEDIKSTRERLKVAGFQEKGVAIAAKKLREKELSIGMEIVSRHAALVKGMADYCGLSQLMEITVPIYSNDYLMWVEEFFRQSHNEDMNNIPMVIFKNLSMLAITKTEIWFGQENGYFKVANDDIAGFAAEKKTLIIGMKNGGAARVNGDISKNNMEQLLYFLNTLYQNMNNEATLAKYGMYKADIKPLEQADFAVQASSLELNEQYVVNRFLSKYMSIEAVSPKAKNIKRMYTDGYEALESKARAGFGIFNDRAVVMYYDSTFFGSAKEGMAVGLDNIYIKNSGENLLTIPYDMIYSVSATPNTLVIETANNYVFQVNFDLGDANAVHDFAILFDDYIKSKQIAGR